MIRKVNFWYSSVGGKYSSILEAEYCGCRWNVPVPFSTTVDNSAVLFVGQDTVRLIGRGTAYKYPSFNFQDIGIKILMYLIWHGGAGSFHKRLHSQESLGTTFKKWDFDMQILHARIYFF